MPPTRDSDDDILDISFDDEDEDDTALGSSPDDDDIEIVFHDEEEPDEVAPESAAPVEDGPEPVPSPSTPQPPTDPKPTRRRPDADPTPSATPKYCPECGFALEPFATKCPRCTWTVGASPEAQETPQPPADAPSDFPPGTAPAEPADYPTAVPRRGGSRLALVIVLIVIPLIAVVAVFMIINSPGYKARAAYRAAVKAHMAGDLQTATQKYLEALDYDPDMGLAAFGLGTTYLGITLGTGNLQRMQQLLDSASAGITTDLDDADRWFDHAIVLANRMPESKSLQDPNISTPRKLASYAHAMKAMTAIIRYYAALQTDSFDIAGQWMQAAHNELTQSFTLDPTNPTAGEFRDALTPPTPSL